MMQAQAIEVDEVTVIRLVSGDEAADIKAWPRSIDLLAQAWCLVEDEAGQVFGGRWRRPGAAGRPLKQLGRAVGDAARAAFGTDGLRLMGPPRAAKVRHKYAAMPGEAGR